MSAIIYQKRPGPLKNRRRSGQIKPLGPADPLVFKTLYVIITVMDAPETHRPEQAAGQRPPFYDQDIEGSIPDGWLSESLAEPTEISPLYPERFRKPSLEMERSQQALAIGRSPEEENRWRNLKTYVGVAAFLLLSLGLSGKSDLDNERHLGQQYDPWRDGDGQIDTRAYLFDSGVDALINSGLPLEEINLRAEALRVEIYGDGPAETDNE